MIYFRRPYSQIEEGGSYIESIVAFKKQPWKLWSNLNKDGSTTTSVIEFKCLLRIDLWLIVLEFNWIKKV